MTDKEWDDKPLRRARDQAIGRPRRRARAPTPVGRGRDKSRNHRPRHCPAAGRAGAVNGRAPRNRRRRAMNRGKPSEPNQGAVADV
jgi:hypothetical protein